MHRTHLAGLLAVTLPWTFASWPGIVLPVLVLLWLRSMTGWAAAMAGAVMYEPRLWPLPVLAVPAAVWVRHRYPPGAITDSARSRLLSWIYLLRDFSWLGHGPGSARIPLEHAHIRSGGLALCGAPAHNEWLEFCYEWGALAIGLYAVVLGGLLLIVHPHHALSASLVAAAVTLGTTSPIRGFLFWLRGGRPSLFGPPIRASITIHLHDDGRAYLYVPHAEHDVDLQARVGQALVLLGQNWIAAHPHLMKRDTEPSSVV